MELKLKLNNGITEISSMIDGRNVAELTVQIPELLNEMTRHLQASLPPEQRGVIYERETSQEIALVCPEPGSVDATPDGEREGSLEHVAGVRASQDLDR